MSTLSEHHVWPEFGDPWDYGAARLLEIFGDGRTELTLEQARVHGVEMPAQAIYTLQLAGYVIDRVRVGGPADRQITAYRLRTTDPTPHGLRAGAARDFRPQILPGNAIVNEGETR